MTRLEYLLERSAAADPNKVAVEDVSGRNVTYGELNTAAGRIAEIVLAQGVAPGDRVGICAPKSVDGIAAIFGILKAGAAYVPVDSSAPPARIAYIFQNCSVRAIVASPEMAPALQEAMNVGLLVPTDDMPTGHVLVQGPGSSNGHPADAELAYILYTSGSTGNPKGVMISHAAAISFVDWCSEIFAPGPDDRFSSHSPFHFDLSIHDIYVAIKHGAAIALISEELEKQPVALGKFIEQKRITIWYSTPSILRLLVQFGRIEGHDYSSVRHVLFAGEVFPIRPLRELQAILPNPRYLNLYGPTETNVCTYLEIPKDIPESQTEPFPIGHACSHVQTAVFEGDRMLSQGEKGELYCAGAPLMLGYWDLPEQNAKAFYKDPQGMLWYKTGDLVTQRADGIYDFHGRSGRMVKRWSYRVELGDIEAALYKHPSVGEAAVISVPDDQAGVLIQAFVTPIEGKKLSVIEMKQFCSRNLPSYMVPDRFHFQAALPKTSTDKTDYQSLKVMA